ncbi:MAG: hypothetical protein P8Y70_04615 [Candidatus Lokiarchaeota archaeon]
MSYTPFDFRVFPIFIYYMIISVFSIYMSIKMYFKWRNRKVKPPLYLFIVFVILTLAVISLSVGLGEAVITGYYKEIYRFSLPLSYSLIILADIILFLFASEMTEGNKKLLIPLIIVGVFIVISLFLPWNYFGVPQSDYENKFSIRLYTTSAVVLFSFVIYIYIAYISFKARRGTENKVARVGFTFLILSMLSMIVFFIMFVIDTLIIVLTNFPGYSIYVYIAWIFAILFFIFSYISLVMPNWVKKRIEK